MASQHPPRLPQHSDTGDKVAIPRLVRPEQKHSPQDGGEKHRVTVACTNCRLRKIKCTGEQPRCVNCESNGIQCEYAQSRKDRLRIATETNIALIDLVEELRLHADGNSRKKVDALLPQAIADTSVTAAALHLDWTTPVPTASSAGGEANTSGSVGSNEDPDLVKEDLTTGADARATGFVGRASTAQWIQSLSRERSHGPPGLTEETAARTRLHQQHTEQQSNIADSSIYLDSEKIHLNHTADAYELPPEPTAWRLINHYMHSVQGAFPIISEKRFRKQVEDCLASVQYRRRDPSVGPFQNNWLTTLNLIFAIGSQFEALTGQGDKSRHRTYLTRAHKLGLTGSAFLEHPDLPLIQNNGLLALYYLCIGQVSRARVSVAISLVFAQALGLHLRNEDKSATALKRESLSRMWWALHGLERLLCIMTGRPSVVTDEFCSVPLPLALPGDEMSDENIEDHLVDQLQKNLNLNPLAIVNKTAGQSDDGGTTEDSPYQLNSYLQALSTMGTVLQQIMSRLYSPGVVHQSWEDVQQSITYLTRLLSNWRRSLPEYLSVDRPIIGFDDAMFERTVLAFQHASATIITTRPCLCRLDQNIKHQTLRSVKFDKSIAQACVDAAMRMTDILSEEADPKQLYSNGPWWAIIHYLMQAVAVFLLKLSHSETHIPQGEKNTVPYVQKLVRWLRVLGKDNPVADRAYKLAMTNLKALAQKNKVIDIAAILAEEEAFLTTAFLSESSSPDPSWLSGMSPHPNFGDSPQQPSAPLPQFTGVPVGDFSGTSVSTYYDPSQLILSDPNDIRPLFGNMFWSELPGQGNPFSAAQAQASYSRFDDFDTPMPDYGQLY